jgi:hypothetical protein
MMAVFPFHRRGALHLPARRSRQNANLFLREPLDLMLKCRQTLAKIIAKNVNLSTEIEDPAAIPYSVERSPGSALTTEHT